MPTYPIQFRRDTEANWNAANPILRDGEMGIAKPDEVASGGVETLRFKIGNGSARWSDLPWGSGPAGPAPEHEWQGTSLRVKNPDGTWGDAIQLKGAMGPKGQQGPPGPEGTATPATKTKLGGVIVGEGLDIDENGCLTAHTKPVPLATAVTPGLVQPDNMTCAVSNVGVLSVAGEALAFAGYLTEFRNFFEQTPPPGWAVRNGAMLENADSAYPGLWAALHEEKNAWKCKSLEEWLALSTAAGGCGGAPFFVLDKAAKTIKLPDTRGDYERGAGSSFLEAVGAWHRDAIRNLTGKFQYDRMKTNSISGGSFYCLGSNATSAGSGAESGTWCRGLGLDASREVPTAAEIRTRAFAVLPCVYVGTPT